MWGEFSANHGVNYHNEDRNLLSVVIADDIVGQFRVFGGQVRRESKTGDTVNPESCEIAGF